MHSLSFLWSHHLLFCCLYITFTFSLSSLTNLCLVYVGSVTQTRQKQKKSNLHPAAATNPLSEHLQQCVSLQQHHPRVIISLRMQQHLMQMQPIMASYNPSQVTTDHIQQYLDENKQLILKILENQNSGKLSECAENQARLQRNLMYLAAIADSQPQPPAMHAQFPNAVGQSGAHYMHQQAQQMTPQSLMAARSSMLYAQPLSAMQQQQLHSQLGMSSAGNGLHMLHNEGSVGGNSGLGGGGFPDFGRSGGEGLHRGVTVASKQDAGSEGRGGSSGGHSGDGESLYLKGNDDN